MASFAQESESSEQNARNDSSLSLLNYRGTPADCDRVDMADCYLCVYCGGYKQGQGDNGDPGSGEQELHPHCSCNHGDRNSPLDVLAVDVSPGVKEREKSFIQRQTRIIILLHHQDFVAYNCYVNSLLQKHPRDPDLRILVALYEAEGKVIKKDHVRATRCLAGIEEQLRQDSLSHRLALTASYLTTKGKVLELVASKNEALSTYEEALQVSLQGQSRCHETPYLLHLCGYSKAHCRNSEGAVQLPSERTWSLIENMKRRACDQHAALKDVMAEDHVADGRSINFFFTWKPVEYLCTLVRSCLVVGFIFFDQMPCPVTNLPKARALIQNLLEESRFMTPRTRILFRLFRCDYQLRIAGSQEPRSVSWLEAMLRAKKHVQSARELARYCQAYPHIHRAACELRAFYIQQKLDGVEKIDWETSEALSCGTRDWISRILQISVIKKPSHCEDFAFPAPEHSIDSMSDPAGSPAGSYDPDETLVKSPEPPIDYVPLGVRSGCPYGNPVDRNRHLSSPVEPVLVNFHRSSRDETPRKCLDMYE